MDSRWGKELKEVVQANKLTFDKAAALIERQIQSETALLLDSRDMSKPDWAVRQAEKVGKVNALKFLLALYTLEERNND